MQAERAKGSERGKNSMPWECNPRRDLFVLRNQGRPHRGGGLFSIETEEFQAEGTTKARAQRCTRRTGSDLVWMAHMHR